MGLDQVTPNLDTQDTEAQVAYLLLQGGVCEVIRTLSYSCVCIFRCRVGYRGNPQTPTPLTCTDLQPVAGRRTPDPVSACPGTVGGIRRTQRTPTLTQGERGKAKQKEVKVDLNPGLVAVRQQYYPSGHSAELNEPNKSN